MLGYIKPDNPELKIKEFELYGGYYCGICKSISKRYGQLPRLALSYDSVFLAILLSGIDSKMERIEQERCIVHPMKKRTIIYDSPEIDYAADILLLLAYYKLKDDVIDEKSKKAALACFFMNGTVQKLMKSIPEKCRYVKNRLEELSTLEDERCPSIDRSAEPFALLMEEVFDYPGLKERDNSEELSKIYRRIGYHIGKWVYLIDAYDDIEENIKSNSFNPLIAQFSYNESEEGIEEFKERIKERTERNLVLYLAEIAKCCGELNIEKNKGIIENILYFGLMRKTEDILREPKQIERANTKKGTEKDAESI